MIGEFKLFDLRVKFIEKVGFLSRIRTREIKRMRKHK